MFVNKFTGQRYNVNSYIEFDTFNMIYVFDICFQLLGSSFNNRYQFDHHDQTAIFFNSDISIYELLIDCLKEENIPHVGVYEPEKEVMSYDGFAI